MPISVEIVSPVSKGDLVSLGDGRFDYTPPANFVGTADFDYQICYQDCMTFCDRATVLLNVSIDGLTENGFIVPEAFTPNDDGINDAFVIPVLRDEPQKYPENELIVINRYCGFQTIQSNRKPLLQIIKTCCLIYSTNRRDLFTMSWPCRIRFQARFA